MANPLVPVTDWFLLRQAEARAAEMPDERRERIRKLSTAGLLRLNAANDLRESTPEIGLILLSDASLFLIAALAETRGKNLDLGAGVGAAWELLDQMKSGLEGLPADMSTVAETLSKTEPMAFDALPRTEALSKFSSAEGVLTWLCKQVDTRSPKDIRRARIIRIGLCAAAVLLVAIWGIKSLFTAPNIALHKPTTACGYWPGSPSDGLTNGENEGGYAVATSLEAEPWIRLDLESVYRISTIVVVPRGDGHAEELVPAVVETSENGSDYSEASRRTDTYSQMFPWKISMSGKKARYVRVRALKSTVLALAEIEVRGRR
jgi:F5/8 type C domain